MPDMIYEKHPAGHYAIFKMNRPDRLNALGGAMRDDLAAALEDFTPDPEMRVGIVTGEGRAFSAGADLKEMAERNAASGQREQQERSQVAPTDSGRPGPSFSRNPKPFIAAVNGLAIGGGLERAADCDIRIASTEAYFALFEVKRGIMAGYAIHNLARIMPFGEAMYLLLTGDTISVDEAHRVGLVHEVLEPQQLMVRAVEIAEMIATNAPLAIQGTKAVAQYWRQMGMEDSRRLGAWVSQFARDTEDGREGPRAFAEKRPAVWKGR